MLIKAPAAHRKSQRCVRDLAAFETCCFCNTVQVPSFNGRRPCCPFTSGSPANHFNAVCSPSCSFRVKSGWERGEAVFTSPEVETLDGIFAEVETRHIRRCAGSINNLLTGPPLSSLVSPAHLEVGHGAWAGQLGGEAAARVARWLEECQLLSNR